MILLAIRTMKAVPNGGVSKLRPGAGELDDVLGLTVIAGNSLADARTGKNGRHALVGLLRQSVFSRLEDVNDAGSLRHDPAMRWIVSGKAAQGSAASPSQMGSFEAQWHAADEPLSACRSSFGTMN